MIKVLIADDSPTLRLLTRSILESDPEVRVVGEAQNGLEAVTLCHKLAPDIITMDIRMPVMNGFDAIRRIMAETPRPIVVLTSSMSDRELGITFKAVEAGALMVIGKPRGFADEDPHVKNLVPALKAMADVKVVGRRRCSGPAATALRPDPGPCPAPGPIRIIAMGASTGGPPALQAILKQLPSDLPVPVAMVQHISHGFVTGLARWLSDTTPLPVKIAGMGEILQPGTAYLAPDDHHLTITAGGQGWLRPSPPTDGHRPSATVLFESLAAGYGPAAAGVILTGMGRDGARGLWALHDAGGPTIAQDESTSIVFGMPKAAIALEAATEVLPLDKIGPRLAQIASATILTRAKHMPTEIR